MRTRRVVAAVLAVVALGACDPRPLVKIGGGVSVRCTEDMACWDCRTMGNRVCGTLPRST